MQEMRESGGTIIMTEKCKSCGKEITALNLSEQVKGWCQPCVEITVEKMHPEVEDPEVRFITDENLNRLCTMTQPDIQWMTKKLNGDKL